MLLFAGLTFAMVQCGIAMTLHSGEDQPPEIPREIAASHLNHFLRLGQHFRLLQNSPNDQSFPCFHLYITIYIYLCRKSYVQKKRRNSDRFRLRDINSPADPQEALRRQAPEESDLPRCRRGV